jgi:hypothetical protein
MGADLLSEMKNPELLALCTDATDARGSLLIPPNWLALLLHPDGRQELLGAGQAVRLGRDDRVLLARESPVAIPLATADTPASCGHLVRASCTLLLRFVARQDDLAALHRALPAGNKLTRADLAQMIEQAGAAAALGRFIRQRPAASLVHEDHTSAVRELLAGQLAAVLFRCGAELQGLLDLSFVSESLAQQEELRRQTAARLVEIESRSALEQAALTATRRRLSGLSEILDKLRAAAGQHDLSWHELLPVLSPAERGRLLENLWRIMPSRTVAAAIVVAAGQECIWLAPAQPDTLLRRVALGEDLGPLRSIRLCRLPTDQRAVLLVGAATGVWMLDADSGQTLGQYTVPDAGIPRTGFNAATIAGDRLFASHSQLGLWSWPLTQGQPPEPILRPRQGLPRTIRAVTATPDGRIVFSADDCVKIWSPTSSATTETRVGTLLESPPAPGPIQCLAIEGQVVYAGTAEGALVCSSLAGGPWRQLHQLSAPFESIQPRRFMDLLELVIPSGPAGICGLYAEEGLLARLVETSVPVRRAWACDDLVVGLSELRDRLIVMNTDQPLRCGRQVLLARQIGHSIQDACIVTQAVKETA